MTGQWEANLKRIERGKARLVPFLEGIENYVREVVGKVETPQTIVMPSAPAAPAAPVTVRDPADLNEILHVQFGFAGFRPNQEEVCRAITAGEDVLLVMPTGSGKSLCYQLPGIALGGTTLVVSPLIALMDDQASKLAAQGFAVERIHSGRDRAASRAACLAYLAGKLNFLFVAPERFRVPGFAEMLVKRRPSLVAIDEAHCISQWGHDFRPDYRTIGRHIPALRPAPVVALTATATPQVQDDITAQLQLAAPRRFIHGFRRDNIAIEVLKTAPAARNELTARVLSAPERRPAIVYVQKRKDATMLAARLEQDFPAAAYHAGLDAARRDEVQSRFLRGELEVIVATIAFGMGIDKPDVRTVIHTALPGSVEGYYQEIGRAGRDGKPSRAILMHSYADRFTHDFFFERDYPEPELLDRIYRCLTPDPQPKDQVRARCASVGEAFDAAVEKLWAHGGAVADYAENLSLGGPDWRPSYLAQRGHRQSQFERMLHYADTPSCRMLTLIRYFGDTEDRRGRCGVCDICDSAAAAVQQSRPANEKELACASRITGALRRSPGVPTGKLHTALFSDGSLDRHGFEELLGAMARSGLVELSEDSFEKDGRRIGFRRATLTALGRSGEAGLQVPVAVGLDRASSDGRSRVARKQKSKAGSRKSSKKTEAGVPAATDNSGAAEKALRAWRLSEARSKQIPAFRILTDRTLKAIAEQRPQSTRELLDVPGIGLKLVEKYGAQIFRVLSQAR
jgi:DNA topoisomerase-3